jgi:iron(III) transport system substrate-binding protein
MLRRIHDRPSYLDGSSRTATGAPPPTNSQMPQRQRQNIIHTFNNLVLISISILLMFIILSCTDKENQKSAVINGKVRIYTSVPLETVDIIKKEFEKEKPGVTLDFFRSGTGEVMKRINGEAAKGRVEADIAWVADSATAEELKEKNLLQKYVSSEVKNIIPIFIDEEGYYTGSRLLNMVVAYNTKLVKEKPKSYLDLLKPEYQGKVGIVSPEYSGASIYTVGTMLMSKGFGWEYFYKLHKNQCQIIKNNELMGEKIANGELSLGIMLDYIVRGLREEHPGSPIDYAFFDDGVVSTASPIALLRDCSNLTTAKIFIDWLLSKKGQELMSREASIVSVNMNVEVPKGMIPIKKLKIIPSNAKSIYRNTERIKTIFRDIFAGKPIAEIKANLEVQ